MSFWLLSVNIGPCEQDMVLGARDAPVNLELHSFTHSFTPPSLIRSLVHSETVY